MKALIVVLVACALAVGGAHAESNTRTAKAEELYHLLLEIGNAPPMPYEKIASMPEAAARAGFPPAAVEEFRRLAVDMEIELRRIEHLMIEAITANYSEEDLVGLVAIAKSDLGRKLGKNIKEHRNVQLTPEEQKRLRGVAKLSWMWKFMLVPSRLKAIQREAEKSLAPFVARAEDIKRRYPLQATRLPQPMR